MALAWNKIWCPSCGSWWLCIWLISFHRSDIQGTSNERTLIHIKGRKDEGKGTRPVSMHPSIVTAHRPRTFLKAGRATPTASSPNPFCRPSTTLFTYLPSQLFRHSLLPVARGLFTRGLFAGAGFPLLDAFIQTWFVFEFHSLRIQAFHDPLCQRPTFNQSQGNAVHPDYSLDCAYALATLRENVANLNF